MDNKLKTCTIKSRIKQNIDPWLDQFLSEFPTVESQELVQMLIDEASELWEFNNIQLISVQSWWMGNRFYYSFITYDDDPERDLRDKFQLRERENFHATQACRLMNHFLAGSSPVSHHIANIDDNMIQTTFSIS